MRYVVFVALLVGIFCTWPGMAGADGPAPVPFNPKMVALDPDAALAAVNAPGDSGISDATVVSEADVETAANEPGASVDGAAELVATTPAACWQQTFWRTWGTFPYQQRVWENRYWCAHIGFAIYYRVTHVGVGGISTLCASHDPYAFGTGGGLGYSWVEVQSGGSFDCPTAIPWITVHTGHWMRVRSNSNGASWFTGQG